MRNLLLTVIVVIGTILLEVTAKTGPNHDKIVVCYLSTWAVYRPDRGSYAIENFDPNLCTHVVYAFAGLDIINDAIKSLDPWQDLKDDYGKGGYERLTAIRKTHPHLKVSLAIGGWNEGSKNYSILAADHTRRERFVKQVSQFVRKYNFDGLDLDWEYPTLRGGELQDKENFVLLVKELREEFNKHGLLLTSAFGAAKFTIDQAYNIRALSKLLDFMHIMCYDYGGSWDKKVGANAPLTSTDPNNVLTIEFTINYLIKMGASPSKLVLGLPFYGRTFLSDLDGYYGDATDDAGFSGPFTRESGFLGYNEICNLQKPTNESTETAWKRSWDAVTAQSILRYRNTTSGKTHVVVYDSSRSIANKIRFLIGKQLAGAMIWSVDTDDFHGDCKLDDDTYVDYKSSPGVQLTVPKRVNNNYPLLRTINEAMVIALNEAKEKTETDEKKKHNHHHHPHDDDNKIPESNEVDPNVGTKTSASSSSIVYLIAVSHVISISFRMIMKHFG